jgi:hypothetical protein
MADDTDLLTDDPEQVEKVADKHERELVAAILSALLLLRPQVVTYQVVVPVRVWRDFKASLSDAIGPLFDAHDAAARALYRAFDSLDPSVVAAEREYRKAFVDEFGAETKRAVDAVFAWGKQNNLAPEQVAEILGYTAGTNRRQTGAMLVKWLQLQETGADPNIIARMMRQLADDAAKARAKTAAATELWNAVQMGRDAAAQQAERRSNEDVAIRKFWEVTPSEALCPVCAAIPGMNPEGVPVGEPFRTPIGPRKGAPIHPRCRCHNRFEVFAPGRF